MKKLKVLSVIICIIILLINCTFSLADEGTADYNKFISVYSKLSSKDMKLKLNYVPEQKEKLDSVAISLKCPTGFSIKGVSSVFLGNSVVISDAKDTVVILPATTKKSINEIVPQVNNQYRLCEVDLVADSSIKEGKYNFEYCVKEIVFSSGDSEKSAEYKSASVDYIASSHKLCNFKDYAVVKQSTCADKGSKLTYCSECGNEKLVDLPLASHKLDNGIIKLKPTCKKKGTKVRKCTVCGKEVNEAIPTISHTLVKKGKVKATFFKAGRKPGTVCKVCGTVLAKSKPTSKLKLTAKNINVKGGKGKVIVKYKKIKNAKGFQVKYRRGKKGKFRILKVKTAKNKTKVIKGLSKGKYTVKVRAFNKKKKYSRYFTKKISVK